MARLHGKDTTCRGLLTLKTEHHDIAVGPAICSQSSCRGRQVVLTPKTLPLLSNASTACMLFFLQLHGRFA